MHDCGDSVVALSGPFVIDAYFTAISLARPRGLHEAGPPACTFRAAPLGLIAVWLQSCERFAAAVTVRGSDGFIAKPLGSHVKGERLAMATPSGLKYEKTRNLQRKLERDVLSYLRGLDEPVPSVTLQSHFDIHQSEDITLCYRT
jgi:hypothetical protein